MHPQRREGNPARQAQASCELNVALAEVGEERAAGLGAGPSDAAESALYMAPAERLWTWSTGLNSA
jgi:hypothetical protein